MLGAGAAIFKFKAHKDVLTAWTDNGYVQSRVVHAIVDAWESDMAVAANGMSAGPDVLDKRAIPR